jgi:hypothetical protein
MYFAEDVLLISPNHNGLAVIPGSIKLNLRAPRRRSSILSEEMIQGSFAELAAHPGKPPHFVCLSAIDMIVNASAFDLPRTTEVMYFSSAVLRHIPHVRLIPPNGTARLLPVTLAAFQKDMTDAGFPFAVRPAALLRPVAEMRPAAE